MKKLGDINKINLPVVDLFCSIQGEGVRAGRPSIFIRVSGCNLRCCFGDSICDTPYSSYEPEKSKFSIGDVMSMLSAKPQIKDIVITGGEPMLYQEEILKLLMLITEREWFDSVGCTKDFFITIETNATIDVEEYEYNNRKASLYGFVDLWSLSPKLHTSIPKSGQEVHYNTSGAQKTKVFTEVEVLELERKRTNLDAIKHIIHCAVQTQLKFVYSGKDSEDEILDIVAALDEDVEAYSDVCIMLMPEGITRKQLNERRKEAAEICIERGWVYTDRLHIMIWGDKRGF